MLNRLLLKLPLPVLAVLCFVIESWERALISAVLLYVAIAHLTIWLTASFIGPQYKSYVVTATKRSAQNYVKPKLIVLRKELDNKGPYRLARELVWSDPLDLFNLSGRKIDKALRPTSQTEIETIVAIDEFTVPSGKVLISGPANYGIIRKCAKVTIIDVSSNSIVFTEVVGAEVDDASDTHFLDGNSVISDSAIREVMAYVNNLPRDQREAEEE